MTEALFQHSGGGRSSVSDNDHVDIHRGGTAVTPTAHHNTNISSRPITGGELLEDSTGNRPAQPGLARELHVPRDWELRTRERAYRPRDSQLWSVGPAPPSHIPPLCKRTRGMGVRVIAPPQPQVIVEEHIPKLLTFIHMTRDRQEEACKPDKMLS